MRKIHLYRIKILNLCILVVFCFIMSSCSQSTSSYVIGPGKEFIRVESEFDNYDEFILASKIPSIQRWALLFDPHIEGVKEYRYRIMGINYHWEKENDSSKTKEISHEMTEDVCIEWFKIIGIFDFEKEIKFTFTFYTYISQESFIDSFDSLNLNLLNWYNYYFDPLKMDQVPIMAYLAEEDNDKIGLVHVSFLNIDEEMFPQLSDELLDEVVDAIGAYQQMYASTEKGD